MHAATMDRHVQNEGSRRQTPRFRPGGFSDSFPDWSIRGFAMKILRFTMRPLLPPVIRNNSDARVSSLIEAVGRYPSPEALRNDLDGIASSPVA